MRLLGISILFAGYALIYASVANHGKFSTEPWAGLLTDAYDTSSSQPQGKTG